MYRDPTDALRVPLVLAVLTAAVAASVLIVRKGDAPVAAAADAAATPAVLGVQVTPAPEPAAPAPEPEPVAPAPGAPPPRVASGVPTAGPWAAAPRATGGVIEIPSIGVRAPVVAVGLDAQGNMVVPRNARDVAWLDNGSFPGPTRNAVMAGHINYGGRQGSFARLGQVREGDVVKVGMAGRTFVFVVRWVRTYDPRTAPVEELLGETPVDSVTLVTCGGPFDRKTRHYTMRIVARAELTEVF